MALNSKNKESASGTIPVEKPVETPALDPDFKKVVEESKQAIAEEGIKPVRKRAPGGGRKPGSVNKTPSMESAPPQNPSTIAPPPEMKSFLKGPIQALSSLPANKYKIPELAFTEDEAVACAESLDQALKAFIPDVNQMSPKTAAVIGCCLTFGSIGFNKYAIYSKVQEERFLQYQSKQEKPPEPTKKQSEEPANIDAGQYFATIKN